MKDISISGIDRLSLFGRNDQHLAHIEKKYGVSLVARGDKLTLQGPDASVREADGLLTHLVERMRHGPTPDERELRDLLSSLTASCRSDIGTSPCHIRIGYNGRINSSIAWSSCRCLYRPASVWLYFQNDHDFVADRYFFADIFDWYSFNLFVCFEFSILLIFLSLISGTSTIALFGSIVQKA